MPDVTDPWKNPRAWETVILNGPKGIYTLPDCSVDVRAGGVKEGEADVAGKDGVTRTFLGYKDAEATVVTRAGNYKELLQIQKALEAYRSKRAPPGEDAIKLEVIHPKFTLHNIKYMYIFDWISDDFDIENGVIFTLELREWQPEEKRTTSGSSNRDADKNKNKGKGKGNPASGALPGALPGAKPSGKPATKQATAAANKPAQGKPSAIANGFKAGSNLATGLLGGR